MNHRIITTAILLIVPFVFNSCGKAWKDVIGLTEKEVSINAEGGEIIIDTAGYFDLFSLSVKDNNGSLIPVDDNYGRIYDGKEIYLKCEWIEVYRVKDLNHGFSLKLLVAANSGEARSCYISVGQGDYFDYVIVNQEAFHER